MIATRIRAAQDRFIALGDVSLAALAGRIASDIEQRKQQPFLFERFTADMEACADRMERELALLTGAGVSDAEAEEIVRRAA